MPFFLIFIWLHGVWLFYICICRCGRLPQISSRSNSFVQFLIFFRQIAAVKLFEKHAFSANLPHLCVCNSFFFISFTTHTHAHTNIIMIIIGRLWSCMFSCTAFASPRLASHDFAKPKRREMSNWMSEFKRVCFICAHDVHRYTCIDILHRHVEP